MRGVGLIRLRIGIIFLKVILKTPMESYSRRLRWADHEARMEEGRSAFKILTGKPTRMRPLGRLRRRWEYNIRTDLKEKRYQYEELG